MYLSLIAAGLAVQVDMASLLEQLNAPSWRAREAATMVIAEGHRQWPLEVLEQQLASGVLTPEQRTRVLMAIERRFLLLPKGALGVRLSEWRPQQATGPQTGVLITEVIAGLPAHEVFQRGDVLEHIDGEALGAVADLIGVVQLHWPGDLLRVQAMRPQGEDWVPIDVTLKLGSMDKLVGPGAPVVTKPPMDVIRMLARLRRTHSSLARTLVRPADPGRGSAAWIIREVGRQRAELASGQDQVKQAVLVARWTTWLMAIDSKLGDRFLDADRRKTLMQARMVLEEAIEANVGE
jgi:hypothetical protein